MRRHPAGLLALTLILALVGLAAGLTLRDSGAQTDATPGASSLGTTTGGGSTEPTDLTRSEPVTTPDPGVPTSGVPAPTSQDAPPVTLPGHAKPTRPLAVKGVGVGSAQRERYAVRAKEQRRSCKARPPATSSLLTVGGEASGRRDGRPSRWLLVLAAIGGFAVAFVAYLVRSRIGPDRRSALEIAGTAFGILAAVGALATNYLGAGVREHPPPSVTMTVREVHARITHGAFEDKVGIAPRARPLSKVDRLEIGNVVWVELHTVDYKGNGLRLQWSMFHAGPGEPFIPDTTVRKDIDLDRKADDQTQFLPIWVGSPRVRRFRAEFRVVQDGHVRQIASTGPMRGIGYRYACRPERPKRR
jgi:hypothetical protein